MRTATEGRHFHHNQASACYCDNRSYYLTLADKANETDVETIAIAQAAMDLHKSVVCSDASAIASDHSDIYRATLVAAIAAIRVAYKINLPSAIAAYAVWLDCMENVGYCVNYVRTHNADDINAWISEDISYLLRELDQDNR